MLGCAATPVSVVMMTATSDNAAARLRKSTEKVHSRWSRSRRTPLSLEKARKSALRRFRAFPNHSLQSELLSFGMLQHVSGLPNRFHGRVRRQKHCGFSHTRERTAALWLRI